MKPVTKGVVVCCPKCGTVANITEIGIGQHVCKNCKSRFTSMVANGFVITFVDVDTDDFFAKLEECKLKLQRLDEFRN
jgi:acetyl-CoA carboxylase beta subunit